MRKIHIYGDINDEAFVLFNRKLDKLESMSNEDIRITLISGGGNAYDALAFFDRIKASKCHIDIVGTGLIASAASIILAAGDRRYMTKNAWVMVHEDESSSTKHKSISEAEKILKHDRRLEDQWCKLFASVTKVPASYWAKANRAETYMTPQACLNVGLIEEII